MAPQKVLITGASGYIGGAVLAELLQLKSQNITISAFVRSAVHRDAVKLLGVTPIHFDGLHDLETIRKEASKHDVVISCASAMDLPSCLAMIEGLGERRKTSKSKVLYIHTSGTSNFGDHPISGAPDLTIHSDEDDIYGWEKQTADAWILRKIDVAITDLGEQLDVKTAVINPPLIYGTGAGPINQHSLQVPALIKIALHEKQAVVLGAGKGIWTFVHISDVAAFYCRLLDHYLSDKAVDVGKKGFYFLEAGETTWLEISQHIAKAGYAQGHWASEELKSITPQQMKEALGVPFLNADMVEVIWGSNSRIVGRKSRALGWEPKRGSDDFLASFDEEVQHVAAKAH